MLCPGRAPDRPGSRVRMPSRGGHAPVVPVAVATRRAPSSDLHRHPPRKTLKPSLPADSRSGGLPSFIVTVHGSALFSGRITVISGYAHRTAAFPAAVARLRPRERRARHIGHTTGTTGTTITTHHAPRNTPDMSRTVHNPAAHPAAAPSHDRAAEPAAPGITEYLLLFITFTNEPTNEKLRS